jgi:putative hydrolase of the HAD superfamily
VNRPHTIVLFDAVGTVIKPNPGVIDVYHQLGIKHGSRLSRQQIQERISDSRRKYFNVGESAQSRFADAGRDFPALDELSSSDEIEREMWQELVSDVFAELDSATDLFDELWDHFEQPENWRVFSDVEACWSELQKHGIEIGLASNFDSRLISIAEDLHPLSSADYVFCSAQVGFRKPSPLFFQQLEEAIACLLGESLEETAIFMVGDDFENDCVAPRLAGWNSVWLNRGMPTGSEQNFGARQKREVTSLYEFTHWILSMQGFLA